MKHHKMIVECSATLLNLYSQQYAIHRIRLHNFNSQKEKRLIDALSFVNGGKALSTAKSEFKDDDLKTFKRTLNDLSNLGINPVTIPKNWGIKHIPNLLYAYFDKVSEELWAEKFDNPSFNISTKI